jgi:O-antigen ligase
LAGLIALRSRFTLVRLTVLVLIPASFVVAISSGSRGPIIMLGIVIVIAALLWVLRGRRMTWRPSGGILALGLASVVVLAFTVSQIPGESLQRFVSFSEFLQSGGTTTGVDNSSLTRVYLYDAALKLFEQHPVIGVGTAGYATLGPRVIGTGNTDEYPHNAVLQFAAEYGLVGLAIFSGLILLALFRPVPDDASRALKLLMLFFFFNAMVSGDVFDDRTLWGLVMLILLVDVRRAAIEGDGARVTAVSYATVEDGTGSGDPVGDGHHDPAPSAI